MNTEAVTLFICIFGVIYTILIYETQLKKFVLQLIRNILHAIITCGEMIQQIETPTNTKLITDECSPGDIIYINTIQVVCRRGNNTITDCQQCYFKSDPENCKNFKCMAPENALYVQQLKSKGELDDNTYH